IALSAMKDQWHSDLTGMFDKSNGAAPAETGAEASAATAPTAVLERTPGVMVDHDGETFELADGAAVIAAITSCTNTSNPDVMVGAGLVARKAVNLGLERKPWVKSSLAPGSQVVTEYLESAGLLDDLEALGFHVVGYGCT